MSEMLLPGEARMIVEAAKKKGLIKGPGDKAEVHKDGAEAAHLNGIRSQWMDVTPALAAGWLQNNFRNRNLREDTVRAYARDMRNGVWVETHQGIAFNDQDELIDGQHRLKAIVLSGVTIPMMVTFGLPTQVNGKQLTTMDAVDRGATRSVGDQLKIQHDMSQGGLVAAVVAALVNLCCRERERRISVAATLEVYQEFREPIDLVIAQRSKKQGLRSAGVLAGVAFALAVERKAEGMFNRFNSTDNSRKDSAIRRLRDFCRSDEAKLISRSMNAGIAEVALQAIYLELQGKPCTRLEHSMDGYEHFKGLQLERVARVAAMFQLPGTAEAKPKRRVRPTETAPAPEPVRLSVQGILHQVERDTGISSLLMTGRKRRTGDIAEARAEVIRRALVVGHSKETIAAVMMCGVEDVA